MTGEKMNEINQSKGYVTICINNTDKLRLCEMRMFGQGENEVNFYVDYNGGSIFIDWGDGREKQEIGYYENAAIGPYTATVYDITKTRIIGQVGGELICFRRSEAKQGSFLPEQKVLAYYTDAGTIKSMRLISDYGIVNGDIIGGAATFIALCYSFDFDCAFSDYFRMDEKAFEEKYPEYRAE